MTREQIEARLRAEVVSGALREHGSDDFPRSGYYLETDDAINFCTKLVAELQAPPPYTTEDEDYDAYATAYNGALEDGETAADLAVIRMFREREARLRQRLQAPPTGEDVEKAWANWERRAVAWNCECGEGTPDAADEAERKMDDAVRDYGAACRAAGRAEAMAEKDGV